MPNHCSNELIITGSKKNIESFKDFAKSSRDPKILIELNNFEKFIDSKYMVVDTLAYTKNNMLWGTKWGCYEFRRIKEQYKDEMGEIRYVFQTAWGPYNENASNAMSKAFPMLRFYLRYAELGMEFCGEMIAFNGKHDINSSYSSNLTGDISWDNDIGYVYKNMAIKFGDLFDNC